VIAVTQGKQVTEKPTGESLTFIRELLDGTYEIAEFCVPGIGKSSVHADVTAARDTMARIRILEKDHNFHVALAHDASWLKKGTDAVLLSLLDEHMKEAAKERIPYDDIP
jgi:hypothetical protein